MRIRQMLNVAKWQSGDVARAEPNMFELCRALATPAKPERLRDNRILGTVTCKSRIVHLKWLKITFVTRIRTVHIF